MKKDEHQNTGKIAESGNLPNPSCVSTKKAMTVKDSKRITVLRATLVRLEKLERYKTVKHNMVITDNI